MANRRKACRIPRSISFAVGNWFTPFDRTIQVTNVNVQCYVRGIGRRPPLPPPPPPSCDLDLSFFRPTSNAIVRVI